MIVFIYRDKLTHQKYFFTGMLRIISILPSGHLGTITCWLMAVAAVSMVTGIAYGQHLWMFLFVLATVLIQVRQTHFFFLSISTYCSFVQPWRSLYLAWLQVSGQLQPTIFNSSLALCLAASGKTNKEISTNKVSLIFSSSFHCN